MATYGGATYEGQTYIGVSTALPSSAPDTLGINANVVFAIVESTGAALLVNANVVPLLVEAGGDALLVNANYNGVFTGSASYTYHAAVLNILYPRTVVTGAASYLYRVAFPLVTQNEMEALYVFENVGPYIPVDSGLNLYVFENIVFILAVRPKMRVGHHSMEVPNPQLYSRALFLYAFANVGIFLQPSDEALLYALENVTS